MSTQNITVNGKPLKDYLHKNGLDHSEKSDLQAPKVNGGIRNHSGARTAPGIVVYQVGQRETHVGILGDIFPWPEKAPFERSGFSVLGAIEMDKDGLVKCHECGTWHKDISNHVGALARSKSSTHSTIKAYRIRHGLFRTHLSSPSVTAKRRANPQATNNAIRRARVVRRSINIEGRVETESIQRELGISRYSANFNLVGACRAQRLSDLRELASQCGRTPTGKELAAFVNKHGRHSLEPRSLARLFGLPVSKICLQAGINPREMGKHIWTRTPEQRRTYARNWARQKRQKVLAAKE